MSSPANAAEISDLNFSRWWVVTWLLSLDGVADTTEFWYRDGDAWEFEFAFTWNCLSGERSGERVTGTTGAEKEENSASE